VAGSVPESHSRLGAILTSKTRSDDLHAWVSAWRRASIDVIRKRRDGKILRWRSRAARRTLGKNSWPREKSEDGFAPARDAPASGGGHRNWLPKLRQSAAARCFAVFDARNGDVGNFGDGVRLRLFRAHRRLREKLSMALQTRKSGNQSCHGQCGFAKRGESASKEFRWGAFAECRRRLKQKLPGATPMSSGHAKFHNRRQLFLL